MVKKSKYFYPKISGQLARLILHSQKSEVVKIKNPRQRVLIVKIVPAVNLQILYAE